MNSGQSSYSVQWLKTSVTGSATSIDCWIGIRLPLP